MALGYLYSVHNASTYVSLLLLEANLQRPHKLPLLYSPIQVQCTPHQYQNVSVNQPIALGTLTFLVMVGRTLNLDRAVQ